MYEYLSRLKDLQMKDAPLSILASNSEDIYVRPKYLYITSPHQLRTPHSPPQRQSP
jgi:hypothetical protein